jgi:hypothetical protein
MDADVYESCVGGDVREGGYDHFVVPWELPVRIRNQKNKSLKQNP